MNLLYAKKRPGSRVSFLMPEVLYLTGLFREVGQAKLVSPKAEVLEQPLLRANP
jgi:hypothetical protein